MNNIKQALKTVFFYIKTTMVFIFTFVFAFLVQIYAWLVALLALPYLKLTGSFENPFKETMLFDSVDEVKEWVKYFFEK